MNKKGHKILKKNNYIESMKIRNFTAVDSVIDKAQEVALRKTYLPNSLRNIIRIEVGSKGVSITAAKTNSITKSKIRSSKKSTK